MELELAEHIKQLELKLLQTDLTANPTLMDDLIAGDFEEISSNGRVNSRNDVVNWLLQKNNNIQWVLTNFRIKVLTDDVVLVIYIAKILNGPNSASKGSIRSSIWKCRDQNWKIIFHQASQIDEIL
ncbi:DUF4440 domain-containing protein [Nitrosomonas sp. Nm166]|uniref:nuclear transport factor 2 family protein n=1 Tax=Nitrosomonas sp. Nm166 TaxID=1881054 RepID=UPI0008EFC198|nr:DUF4440 domain-containing protein [Nitrosomonas sp. Nm166]SFE09231.1 hypothetical protein SAMN05428977_100689 [Nitrosomonas sp. Nm166]